MAQFLLAVLASLLISVILLGFYERSRVKAAYVSAEKPTYLQGVNASAAHLESRLKSLGNLTMVLATDPLIRRFVQKTSRTKDQSYNESRSELQSKFYDILELDNKIMQLRLIDSSTGNELFRVERASEKTDRIIVIDDQNLQNKEEHDYVKEGRKVLKHEYYLSNIDLNVEYGKVANPPTKVVRTVAGIYSDDNLIGLVVVNYLIEPLLKEITAELPPEVNFAVFDQELNLLVQNSPSSILEKINEAHEIAIKNERFVIDEHLVIKKRVIANDIMQRQFYIFAEMPVSINTIFSFSVSNTYRIVLSVALSAIIILLWWFRIKSQQQDAKIINQANAIDEANQLNIAIFNTVVDSIVVINAHGVIESVNHQTELLFGYDRSELIGKNVAMLMPEPVRSEHDNYINKYHDTGQSRIIGVANREVMGLRKDGTTFYVELGVSVLERCGERKFVGVIRDITERRAYQEKIEKQAYYDPLTQIPNRLYIRDRLKQVLASARRHNKKSSILFLDLDRYKVINDTYGHTYGDEVLKQVAQRIAKLTRDEDTIGRLGGDEFVVILSDLSTDKLTAIEKSFLIGEKLREALMEDFVIYKTRCHIGASIGIYIFPEPDDDITRILQFADMAMYKAKEQGRNRVVLFNQEDRENTHRRIAFSQIIRVALDEDRFFLLYQPVYNGQGDIVGAEALIRMQESGIVREPEAFIETAECSSAINEIGKIVIMKSMQTLSAWREAAAINSDFRLSINVSPFQLFNRDFIELVSFVLAKYDVNPKNITLEITEGVALYDRQETKRILNELAELGLGIAIDDFGTGYSSINYIRRLPVSELKIDKSLVSKIKENKNDRAIVDSIINLAKNLGLTTVAEGVEQEVEFEMLNSFGCDLYQGYYFCKPITDEAFCQIMSVKLPN